MIRLGCILIPDLVVIDLLMHSLPGMILLYLATSFFSLKVFLHEICIIRSYIATVVCILQFVLLHSCISEGSNVLNLEHR